MFDLHRSAVGIGPAGSSRIEPERLRALGSREPLPDPALPCRSAAAINSAVTAALEDILTRASVGQRAALQGAIGRIHGLVEQVAADIDLPTVRTSTTGADLSSSSELCEEAGEASSLSDDDCRPGVPSL
jgi:hypothetical protein